MTKYDIMTDNFELRLGRTNEARALTADEVFSEYQAEDANAPMLIESYDNYDDALAAFNKTYANYGSTRAVRGVTGWLLLGQVAFLIENEYDEDGEFDQGGDVWAYSAEAYGVVLDKDGMPVNYFAAVELMDDDLREELHEQLSPCSNQEFFNAYLAAHEEKYGEDFTV